MHLEVMSLPAHSLFSTDIVVLFLENQDNKRIQMPLEKRGDIEEHSYVSSSGEERSWLSILESAVEGRPRYPF